MPSYETIIFLQGDEADEALNILYGREPGDTSPVYYGPYAETIDEAMDYLAGWDYGDPTEQISEEMPGGLTGEGRYVDVERGYVMSWHLGLTQIGLARILSDEED